MPGALFNPATLDTNPYDKTQYNMGEAVQSGLKSADLQIEREGKERATAALPKYLDTKEQANVTSQQMADILTHFPGVVSAKNEIAKLDTDTADAKNKHMKDALASMLIAGVAAEKQGQDPVQVTNDMAEHFASQGVDMSQFKNVPDWSKRVTLMRSLLGNYDDLKTQVSEYDQKTIPGKIITRNPLGDQIKMEDAPKQPEDKGTMRLDKDGKPVVVNKVIPGVGTVAFTPLDFENGTTRLEPLMNKEAPNPAQAKPTEPRSVTYGGVPGTVVNGKFVPLKDQEGKDLTPPGGEKPVGGAKGAQYTEQIRIAASEAWAEFENVSELMQNKNLPIRSAFQDAQDAGGTTLRAFKNFLAQKATPEESNIYVAAAAGLDLALSRIQNAGQPAQQAQIKQMREALKFTNADDRYSMLYKINNAKQRVIKALEGWQLGTQSQRDEIKAVADMIRNDPSYIEPSDMTRIARGEEPKHMNDAKTQGALAPAAELKPYAYQQGQQLRPGATVNGMVYTGGNPKDKANWRKQ